MGAGIVGRRRRSRPDTASLKQKASMIPGYYDGALLMMSTTEDQTATAILSDNTAEADENNKLFPNAGKNVLESGLLIILKTNCGLFFIQFR